MKAQDLKNSILQLAVEGKLVPQDPSDEPASELLARIREERAELIKQKKIKKPKGGESVIYRKGGGWYERRGKSEPACIDDEIPFDIPESWEWARLGFFVDMQAGKNIAASNIVETMDEDHPYPCYGGNGLRGFVGISNRCGRFPIIGRQGALCGCINYADGEFYATEHAVVVTCFANVNVDWCGEMLKALNLNQYATATAQPGLAVSKISEILSPVPPIAEQRRIVARVDELMPLVEEYGRLEGAREKLDAELPDRLRKSVLQLAVQGKLVPQDPSDEPASELLERIRAERADLVKQKKIRKPKGGESVIYREGGSWYERRGKSDIYRASDGGYYEKRGKSEPVCIDDEIPFDIPESWEWARMGSVLTFINGRAYKKSELLESGKYPVLRVGNLFTNSTWYYSDLELPKEKYCHRGDLLYAWSASFGPTIWNGETCIFHYHIWNVLHSKGLYRRYLYWFLENDVSRVKSATTGSTMIHVSMEHMIPRLIAIPPLSEQKRIVEKIDQIMKLIGA